MTQTAPKILCRRHITSDGQLQLAFWHGPACPASDMDLHRRIQMAIADPGAVLARLPHDADEYESIPAWSTRALAAVLEQLAYHRPELLLGQADEETQEFGVLWHGEDPYANPDAGIRMHESRIGFLNRAVALGEEKIGQYGITHFTVEKRVHRSYPNGGSWSGPWQKLSRDEVEAAR